MSGATVSEALAKVIIIGENSRELSFLQAGLTQLGYRVDTSSSHLPDQTWFGDADLLIVSNPSLQELCALADPLPPAVVILADATRGLTEIPPALVGKDLHVISSASTPEAWLERLSAFLPRPSPAPSPQPDPAQDQALLLEITKSLSGYGDDAHLFERILSLAPRLGADFASILVLENEETVYFRSSIPGQEELTGPPGRRFAQRLLSEGLEGWVLRHGRPQIIADVHRDKRWYRAAYLLEEERAVAALPFVMKRARARGVLILGSLTADRFSDKDLPRLTSAATQIALAIENTLLFKNESERSAQLSLINEVGRVATSILSLDMMLVTVVQAIQRSFGFHGVAIYQLTPTSNSLRLEAYTGADRRSHRASFELSIEEGIVGWVARHGTLLMANDVRQEPRYRPESEDSDVKSELAVPIRLGVKTIGVLDLQSIELDAFNPPLVEAMEILADQLAIAIENANLYEEINVRIRELTSLNEIGRALTSSLNLSEILTLITARSTQLLDVAATSVVLRDDESQEVWFAAASGEGSEEVLGVRMKLGQGIAGWVAATGEPVIVPDVRKDARFFPDIDADSGFTTRSILCVPLKAKGRTIGAIEVMNKRTGLFDQEDLRRLAALAAPAATAIENARLYEDLREGMRRLEETQAQLIQSAKLAAVGELAAGVAHEINNPLTSIIGLARLLLVDTARTDPHYDDVHTIDREADRARIIVRGLLDFARASEPRRTPTNFNELVEEAIVLVYTKSVRYRLELVKNFSDLPLIPLDTNQIKQVIVNLVNNAIYAMPQKGTLTLSTEFHDDVGGKHSPVVVFKVKDTGVGLDPAIIDKIFDPFFTTKEVGQGTGLGLSVSYGIIDRHGGHIEVESEPGRGAEFTVILPLVSDP